MKWILFLLVFVCLISPCMAFEDTCEDHPSDDPKQGNDYEIWNLENSYAPEPYIFTYGQAYNKVLRVRSTRNGVSGEYSRATTVYPYSSDYWAFIIRNWVGTPEFTTLDLAMVYFYDDEGYQIFSYRMQTIFNTYKNNDLYEFQISTGNVHLYINGVLYGNLGAISDTPSYFRVASYGYISNPNPYSDIYIDAVSSDGYTLGIGTDESPYTWINTASNNEIDVEWTVKTIDPYGNWDDSTYQMRVTWLDAGNVTSTTTLSKTVPHGFVVYNRSVLMPVPNYGTYRFDLLKDSIIMESDYLTFLPIGSSGTLTWDKSSYVPYQNASVTWAVTPFTPADYSYYIKTYNINTGLVDTNQLAANTGTLIESLDAWATGSYYSLLNIVDKSDGTEYSVAYDVFDINNEVRFEGITYDAENGIALGSTNVSFLQALSYYNDTSNATGYYELSKLTDSLPIEITATKTNFIHEDFTFTPPMAKMYETDLYLFPTDRILTSTIIEGMTVDYPWHQGIGSATVNLYNATWSNTTTSNTFGYYQFNLSQLITGTYTVNSTLSGYDDSVEYEIDVVVNQISDAGITWTKSASNPVLTLGANGTWDDAHAKYPSVINDSGTFKMWYSGYNGINWQTGYATSPDGITWTKDGSNPVLTLGANGTWDDTHAFASPVINDSGTFKMWYSGDNGTNTQIGYATSPDGITWTKDGSNPVLTLGAAGTWDDAHAKYPSVINDSGTFKMWYSGYNGTNTQTGYATSPDGITWTKDASNPVLTLGAAGTWDDERAYTPSVINDSGTFKMWYSGDNGTNTQIGYATSIDEFEYSSYVQNIVLNQPYTLTVTAVDSKTSALLQTFTATVDGTTQSVSGGTATFNLEYGLYTVNVASEGYYPSSTNTLLDQDRSVSVSLTPIVTDYYDPAHYVKFTVRSIWGTKYTGIEATVYVGSSTTALFTNSTESDGAVVFELDENVKYRITFINATQGISETRTLYPVDNHYYVIVSTTFDSWDTYTVPISDAIDFTISKEEIDATHAYINFTYVDHLGETTALDVYLNQTTSSDYFNQTNLDSFSGAGNTTHSFIVSNYVGQSYLIHLVAQHDTYGKIDSTYSIGFKGEIADKFPGIPASVWLYGSVFILLFTGGIFVNSNVEKGMLVVCIMNIIFLGLGCYGSLPSSAQYSILAGTVLGFIVSLIANLNKSNRDEGFN